MSYYTPIEKELQDILKRIERLEDLIAEMKKEIIINEKILYNLLRQKHLGECD